jgi:hypothetical protein
MDLSLRLCLHMSNLDVDVWQQKRFLSGKNLVNYFNFKEISFFQNVESGSGYRPDGEEKTGK